MTHRPTHTVRIVLCYPAQPRHIAEISVTAPDADVVHAGQEGIGGELPTADIFCGHAKVPIDWEEVVRRGRLRWIQSSAAGLDHCLSPPVVASNQILVTSASGLFADQVAEHAMALMLGLLRSLPRFLRAQAEKEFQRRPTADLKGKTVGIVGFGGNGRRLAEVLQPFDVRIIATDMFPRQKPAYVAELLPADQLHTLLQVSDIVVLCVPLTEVTRGMLDATQLGIMKSGAWLINVARGPVVVETALVEALETGHLAGAGLDVTQEEPLPAESGLWQLSQVVITPHVGAQSHTRLAVHHSFETKP